MGDYVLHARPYARLSTWDGRNTGAKIGIVHSHLGNESKI